MSLLAEVVRTPGVNSLCLSVLVQLMFAKSRGSVSLGVELLDTEEENSDEPADSEVTVVQVVMLLVLDVRVGVHAPGVHRLQSSSSKRSF